MQIKIQRHIAHTIQCHFSSDVNGFEELQYHANSASIQQAVRLVQPQMAQCSRSNLHLPPQQQQRDPIFPPALVSMAAAVSARASLHCTKTTTTLLQKCLIIFATRRSTLTTCTNTGIMVFLQELVRASSADACVCRHVILPKEVASSVPVGRLMSEAEWRKLGVQQSRGWVHYMIHKPGEQPLRLRPALQ